MYVDFLSCFELWFSFCYSGIFFYRPVGSLVGAAVSIASLVVYFMYPNSLHNGVNEDQLSAYILTHEAASYLVWNNKILDGSLLINMGVYTVSQCCVIINVDDFFARWVSMVVCGREYQEYLGTVFAGNTPQTTDSSHRPCRSLSTTSLETKTVLWSISNCTARWRSKLTSSWLTATAIPVRESNSIARKGWSIRHFCMKQIYEMKHHLTWSVASWRAT